MVTAVRRDERPPIGYAREALRGELPPEFVWVESLTRPHLMQFIAELKEALMKFGISGDDAEVIELLDAWKATAGIDADPEAAKALREPLQEDDYVDWVSKGSGLRRRLKWGNPGSEPGFRAILNRTSGTGHIAADSINVPNVKSTGAH